MKNEAFKKFQTKLRWEGFLRSFLCGLVIGFAVLLVSATVCWFVGFKGIWLSFVLFAVAVAVSTTLFYFLMFSPDTKKMAKRIDELGLEERIITMTELEGDDSFIAVKQREDAMAALNKVNASAMKLVISVPIIIACAAVGVCTVGMTTVHALNIAGVVPSGIELVRGENDNQTYRIFYSVDGKGLIFGVSNGDKNYIGSDNENTKYTVDVVAGEESEAVIAVADKGYVFVGWSDGYSNPFRASTTINENKNITALFQPIPDAEEETEVPDDSSDSEEDEKDGNEENVIALKAAVGADKNLATAVDGEISQSKDKKPSNNLNLFYWAPYFGHATPISSETGNVEGPGSGSGGQDNSASQQIIDGNTYYGDVFENAYEEAMSYLSSGEDIPDYLKKIIKDYYDTIAK